MFHQQREDVPKSFSPSQIQRFNFKPTNLALPRSFDCYGYKTALHAYGHSDNLKVRTIPAFLHISSSSWKTNHPPSFSLPLIHAIKTHSPAPNIFCTGLLKYFFIKRSQNITSILIILACWPNWPSSYTSLYPLLQLKTEFLGFFSLPMRICPLILENSYWNPEVFLYCYLKSSLTIYMWIRKYSFPITNLESLLPARHLLVSSTSN